MPSLVPITLLVAACTVGQFARAAEPADPRPLVYVVDGAGGYGGCSTALAKAVFAEGNPVEVTPFAWSHGYRKLLLDQVDSVHARKQGMKLADAIRSQKACEPGRRVVVVAHSAGSAVALTAAEQLAADSIDRLILLAPSVSKGYDLRPAVPACREGIDVFCSSRDRLALGVAIRLVGTADDHRSRKAAGRVGFDVPPVEELAGQVRQHFWSPELRADGHDGGHYGAYSPTFTKKRLLPMMTGDR